MSEHARFSVEASFALRGATKSSIKREAFSRGLMCSVDEDKGFLFSTYYFTITGPGANAFVRDVQQWIREGNAAKTR